MGLEWLLTLDLELLFIWNSRWSIMKILYLVTRYLPFTDVSMVLWHQFGPPMSVSHCFFEFDFTSVATALGIALAEISVSDPDVENMGRLGTNKASYLRVSYLVFYYMVLSRDYRLNISTESRACHFKCGIRLYRRFQPQISCGLLCFNYYVPFSADDADDCTGDIRM
ncbi:hypothetical protein NP233_g11377 [Leucocoprinus birnbaumii]|uniref:DUF6533 domain-containing protein n=1 Tax=Leucocoprinus birnbaumii TaxID=56174 RepID=A0AAD5VGN6_9AGAR|nr:hypothetical protein NP233_g11377 [Leucocoprinus birnbaumii]